MRGEWIRSVYLEAQVNRVFVSSTTTFGNFGGLAAGDAFCQSLDDAAPLGGTWVAWLSDSTTDAVSRLTPGSFELVDGTPVAASIADLTDGTLINPINLDESGGFLDAAVWTGTDPDGTTAASGLHCANWTDDAPNGQNGNSNENDDMWTSDGDRPCDEALRLYCFEGPSGVPTLPNRGWSIVALAALLGASWFVLVHRRSRHSSR